ncbi:carboxyl-terminal-processing peptidase 1, chloroplastic [Dorcoceras hygrometricum]|uniref:Carboxyl-terminal-processing peptidase 1, chloroplastic n=1 Tax=Dorcoceras hygrometricum TaxID=472368 RepID=A0A2Z7DGI1_9LAMI|nr:carboxyl-terminal-processing peptidase 1, chloroplastic [Dorcoceras hygrometricum]
MDGDGGARRAAAREGAAAVSGRRGGREEATRVVKCRVCHANPSRTSILPPPMLNKLSLNSVQESRNQYLCDPQWFRDTACHGPTTCVTPKPHFRTSQSDQGKAPSNIAHDPLGITDSAFKNQLVIFSVQYGPFNTYIPIRSTIIGKSRVARDPITMHISRRSNSDIACVTSIGYPRTKASGESSTTKHRLLDASGPHPIPPPNDPN